MNYENVDKVIARLQKEGVKFIELGLQDFNGLLRSRTIKLSKAKNILADGMRIDGYSVGYAEIEDSDMLLIPDLDTIWVYRTSIGNVAFIIGDLYTEKGPVEYYPRNFLKKVVKESPYNFKISVELEFYVLQDGNPADNGYYMASYPTDSLDRVKMEFIQYMEHAGVDITFTHHEVGPGQHEFLTPAYDLVKAADFIVFFKKAVKTFFWERGYFATFMPKPFQGKPGNGMHLHVSVFKEYKNIFVENGEMTENLKFFVGGIMDLARKIAVFTNPTVNSYKRLVVGFEAPVYLVWGRGNRSAYIRVPIVHKNEQNMRLELRAPDSSGNAYLLISSVICAGLRGLEKRVDPGEEYKKNAYKHGEEDRLPRLPSTLMESIEEAARSEELKEFMPGELLKRYLKVKEKEWREYINYLDENSITDDPLVVTEWEKARYLDI